MNPVLNHPTTLTYPYHIYSTVHRLSPPPLPIADTGASFNFAVPGMPLHNRQATTEGMLAIMPNDTFLKSSHTGNFPFPNLPPGATACHEMPGLREPLCSIPQICDHGYTAVFDRHSLNIYNDTHIQPVLQQAKLKPVINGFRDETRMWRLPFVPSPSPVTHTINSAYHQRNKVALAQFLHAAAGSPVQHTWITAIKKGFFASWPSLTPELVTHFLPKSEATIKGHMAQQRQNIRSTKPANENPTEPPPPVTDFASTDPHFIYLTVYLCKGAIATDQTGAFPVKSSKGNQYIMVLYAYDPNVILVEPLKSRKGAELLRSYKKLTNRLIERGLRPKLQRLDNEASNEMKKFMRLSDIDFQLVPPHNHRRNAAERAIRTFKEHFIAILCSTDKDFPMQQWDELLPQAELTINLLRQSNINPKLSAWNQLEGIFDFNRTPLAPPGTRVIVYEQPNQRRTWAPHGLNGFYVGPALDHYRCYRCTITNTSGTRIADTVEFFPTKYRLPNPSSGELLLEVATELTHALQNPTLSGPLAPSEPHLQALRDLSDIFTASIRTSTSSNPAPSPRVIETNPAPPPRVPPLLPAPLPRVVNDNNTPTTPPRNHRPYVPQITPDRPMAPARPSQHRYNTRSQGPHLIQHTVTVQTDSPRFSIRTQNWTAGALHAFLINEWIQSTAQTFQPMVANHVIDESTGKILQYKDLINRDEATRILWNRSFANELGRLAQGVGNRYPGTNTIFFIHHHQMPKDRKATYGRIVVDLKPHKEEQERTRLTVGGNLIDFPGDVSAKVADLTTAKVLFNSVVSTPKAKFMGIDVKNFYLGTPMERYEYMFLPIEIIPLEIIEQYNLLDKVHQGKIYIEIRRGMYGLPQAGIIAQQLLTKRLANHGYAPCRHTPGLWTHKTRPIHFSLVVDDFGVKYINKDDAQHLIDSLATYYPITIDWTGDRYCGVYLKWDYTNRSVTLSIPDYVNAALHEFQHPQPKRPYHAPSHWTRPDYGAKQQMTTPDISEPMSTDAAKLLQRVVGKFLFYARAVDPTMLHILNNLASAQTHGTQHTVDTMTYFLNYCATHPDASITYTASDMILRLHSDASYLSENQARSRIGGHFYLGFLPISDKRLNGPILAIAKILKNVMSSAAEAEIGATFHNCKEAVPIRTTLEELGHPQPATPVQVDNTTAIAIANKTCKQVRSKAIDMRFYWVQDRVEQGQFHIFWAPGAENMGDYYTKHHPIYHHQQMRPQILNQRSH